MELCLHTNSQWEQRPQNSEQGVPFLANWNIKFLFYVSKKEQLVPLLPF